MKGKPTIEECLEAIKYINKDIEQPQELLLHKANWLYILNKLNFFEDLPILINLIKYEQEQCRKKQTELSELPTHAKRR